MQGLEEQFTSSEGAPAGESSGAETNFIQVLVRVRPLFDNVKSLDLGAETVVDIQSSQSLAVTTGDGKRSFQCSFDSVLGPFSSQSDLYRAVQSGTRSVLDGFNSTIFAYGQTGSGKTYSMYGPPGTETTSNVRTLPFDSESIGVIPRAINEVFALSEDPAVLQVNIYCSFVQIYNEQLFDMLRDASMITPLTIREDSSGEIYVQGLSEYNVKTVADTMQLLRIAEENRTVRQTYMNEFSSRSHSIFQLFVEQKRVAADGGEVYLRAKFNLVDLAGSEKWNTRQMMQDAHIQEMTNINLSLHTLGRCISSLAARSQGREAHVPYRESKLTRLLQDSLGGNARTFLIATISPARANAEESISTLKFADHAKQVMVQATVNETRPVDHVMVQKLQGEVERLRAYVRQVGGESALTALTVGTAEAAALVAGASTAPSTTASLISSLELALQEERARLAELGGHNERLQRELASVKVSGATSVSTPARALLQEQQAIIPAHKAVVFLGALQRLVAAHTASSTARGTIWLHVDSVQKTMKRFFRFEVEEDAMRREVESSLAALAAVRDAEAQATVSSSDPSVAALLEALAQLASGAGAAAQSNLLSPMRQPAFEQAATEVFSSSSSSSSSASVPVGEAGAARRGNMKMTRLAAPISRAPAQPQPQPQQYLSPSKSEPVLPVIYPSHAHTEHQHQYQHQQVQQVQQVQGASRFSVSAGVTSASSLAPSQAGVGAYGPRQRLVASTGTQGAGPHVAPSAQYGMPGPTTPTYLQQHQHQQHQQHDLATQSSPSHSYVAAQSNQRDRDLYDSLSAHTQAFSSNGAGAGAGTGGGGGYTPVLASARGAGPPVTFRVRGSGDFSGGVGGQGWAAPPTEEDEERALQREMKKAKKRLKKQQQLQEWMAEKEQKALAAQRAAEQARLAAQEDNFAREQRRRDRARKQKEKLAGYQARIKTEAEQINELVELGIDPASLGY